MAEKIVYEYETPDGILEWEDDATPEGEARARAGFAKAVKASAPPDNRDAGQLRQDQARSQLKGMVKGPVQGAWGIGEGLGKVVGNTIMGQPAAAGSELVNLAKGALGMIWDPFERAGKGVGELIAPGSVKENLLDPEQLTADAENAGGQFSGAALGARAATGKAPSGVELVKKAGEMRKYSEANPVLPTLEKGVDLTKPLSIPGSVARAGKSVGAKAGAPVVDLAAKAKLALEGRQARAAAAKARANMPPEAPSNVRQPKPAAAGDDLSGFYERQRQAQAAEDAAAAAAEAERAQNQQVNQQVMQEQPVEQPQPQSASAENNDWIRNRNTRLRDIPKEDLYPEIAQERPPLTPEDVMTLQEAVSPTGSGAQTWLVRNAERVLDYAPELRGLPKGEQFLRSAIDAYNRADMELHAAERSVPPSTMVDKIPLQKDLLAIQADYVQRNLPTEAKALEKVMEGLDQHSGLIEWDGFMKLKNSIWKENSSAVRRARGAFIKAMENVSPELAKAGQNYSIMRRVIEGAKVDPLTRRPLKPVRGE